MEKAPPLELLGGGGVAQKRGIALWHWLGGCSHAPLEPDIFSRRGCTCRGRAASPLRPPAGSYVGSPCSECRQSVGGSPSSPRTSGQLCVFHAVCAVDPSAGRRGECARGCGGRRELWTPPQAGLGADLEWRGTAIHRGRPRPSFQGPSACSGPGWYGGCRLSILGYVLRLPHLPELILAAPILQMGNLRPRRCRSLSRATPDSSPQFMGPRQ